MVLKLELNSDPTKRLEVAIRLVLSNSPSQQSCCLRFPGDRFIPNRSLMDLDQACSLLTNRTNYPTKCNFGAEYRKIMEENLTLDSEGRPFRMLVFKGSPKSSRKSIRYIDELRRSDEENLNISEHPIHQRKFQQRETRILDAPLLQDDFYMNVMDWGKNNILAVGLGRDVYLWNATNRSIHHIYKSDVNDCPSSVSWSQDGKMLAVGHARSEIDIWDAHSSKIIKTLKGHTKMVGATSWNGHILTSGSIKAILNHDGISSINLYSFHNFIPEMKNVELLKLKEYILTGSSVRNSFVSSVKAHRSRVCGLKWSMSGNLLASGGDDNVVYIWEASQMNSARFVHRFTNHVAGVKALAWCPYNYEVLASGGGTQDGCIKLWNTQKGTCITSVNTEAQICGLEWNRHYKEIASAHGYSFNHERKNALSLWRYPSMVKVGDIRSHQSRVLQLSQNPDGLTLASAGADETLRFWEFFGPPPPAKRPCSVLSLKALHIR